MTDTSIWNKLQSCDSIVIESCYGKGAVLDIQGNHSKALDCPNGLCLGIEIVWADSSKVDINRISLLLSANDETLNYALLPQGERWFLWQRYSDEPSSEQFTSCLEPHITLAKYISSGLCKQSIQDKDSLLEIINLA